LQEKIKMKNAITNIIDYLSSNYASRKTFNSNAAETVPDCFTPETKRIGLLVSAVLFVFLSLFLTGGEARAASYIVNSNIDATDINEGNGVCDANSAPGDQCTLRAALQEANYIAGTDFISFDLPLPSVITLGGNGALVITESVNIIGPGARALSIESDGGISGGGDHGIFVIFGSNKVVSISGVTIANGNTTNVPSNTPFTCGPRGGGICLNSASLSLTAVTVRNNTATTGGGIYVSSGNLSVRNSTISNNPATFSGGGIEISSGGTAGITNSTISNNTSSSGFDGGGGGGVYNSGGATLLTNVTVSGNTATGGPGGGVRNVSGTLSVRNTIIAGNTAGSNPDAAGTLNSLGNNLIGISAGNNGVANNVNGDKVGTSGAPINPMLGALQSNGGQTDTQALLSGSPAIDAGNNCVAESAPTGCLNVPLTTDQRGEGFSRQLDGDNNGTAIVDVGAFESPMMITTAAVVVISGRVSTATGRGIRNVRVTVTFPNGETRSTVSSLFGYYRFNDIPAGETYLISVSGKRYSFSNNIQIRNIAADALDVNFIADDVVSKGS
jgi:hypothetical protein